MNSLLRLTAAAFTVCAGIGAAMADKKPVVIEPSDPTEVRVMSNLNHRVNSGSLSADERYLFTTGGDELGVWDVATGKIIKVFPLPGLERVYSHPTNSAWVMADVRESGLSIKRPPLVVIDWMKGEIVGRVTRPEVPLGLTARNQSASRRITNGLKTQSSDFGMLPMKIWGVEISSSDSLLLTGGMRPVLYDLCNLRPHARLPYLEYMMANDSTLDFSDYSYMPKRRDHKGSKRNAFLNRFVFDTHFADSATIRMGGATPVVTTWNTDGLLIAADTLPMLREGPVFDVVSASGTSMAGTLYGTMLRQGEDDWKVLYNLVQTPPRDDDKSGWSTLLGAGRNFLESMMTTFVSKPFGSPGQERVLVSLVFGELPRHSLVNLATGTILCVSNHPGWGDLDDCDILPDGKSALAVNGYNAAVWDWSRGDSIRIRPLGVEVGKDGFLYSCRLLPDGNFLFGAESGALIVTDPAGKTLKRIVTGNGQVRALDIDKAGKRLYAMHSNNCVTIWNLPDIEQVVSLYYFAPDKVMAVTPDHYYTMPPAVGELVHFSRDNRVYSFSQFDMRNNRPDIVLERLGGNPDDVDMLHKAWLKRLRRNGLTPEMLAADYNVPVIDFVDADRMPDTVDAPVLSFGVEFADAEENIEFLEVAVNGVPVVTDDRINLPAGKPHRKNISLDLANGENHITVGVRNRRGTSSLKAEHDVTVTAPSPRRTLYAVCIGVSDYADAGYSLNYAAKDAADVANLLKEKSTEFHDVRTLLLRDGEFTDASLGKVRDFVRQAARDDAVMLFYAGHGVVDTALDYYLAPHDMDFSDPARKGVAIEAFTGLLDGCGSLKRYIIIDACHSGRIDKDDFMAANVAEVPTGDSGVVFRGAESLKFRSKEIARVNQLVSSHFADFNSAAGALVASSASGMEVAVESPEWQNGIFTYHLIRGMENNDGSIAADADSDGAATMEELLEYAVEMVPRTTSGAQNPSVSPLDSSSRPLVISKSK